MKYNIINLMMSNIYKVSTKNGTRIWKSHRLLLINNLKYSTFYSSSIV